MADLLVIPPEWSQPVVERRSWLTDLHVARDGSESRAALREVPRRTLRYRIVRDGHRARLLDAQAWGWTGGPLALPMWTDRQRLAAPLASGATEIPCATSGLDFRAGGTAALVAGDLGTDTEQVTIASVGPASLTLSEGTTRAWPAGTLLVPVREGRVAALGRGYRTAHLLEGEVELELTDLAGGIVPAPSPQTYRGRDVDVWRPHRVSAIETGAERVVERVDSETGVWFHDEQLGRPVATRTLEYLLRGRAQIRGFLAWLEHLQGRVVAFWQSTGEADLELVDGPIYSEDVLHVRSLGYMERYALRQGRRDVALYHRPTGTLVTRRVLLAEEESGVETLSLDSAPEVEGPPSDFLVSWLELVRLDSDDVEIAWLRPELARVTLGVREVVVEG